MSDSDSLSRSKSGMKRTEHQYKLYGELASWWPLLSRPEDYDDDADCIWRLLTEACETPPETVLELGSGGGNTASHLKARARLTLVDRSEGMVQVSRALNPECEHLVGDMRNDLDRTAEIVAAAFL